MRVIGQAANKNTGIDWKLTRFHDYHGDASGLKGILRPSDVIINSTGTGTLGRVGFFDGGPDKLPSMADSHITVARFKAELIHPRFGYYWIQSQPFQEYISAALTVGATNQIELNRDRLVSAQIPIPPLTEQHRIVNFLDVEAARIDQLLAIRGKQANLLTAALKARAVEATGRALLQLDADGSRELTVPLRRALQAVQTGTTPGNLQDRNEATCHDAIPWYTPAALSGLLSVGEAEKFVPAEKAQEVPHFPAGSILITGIGESLGKVGFLDRDATGNQQITAMTPNQGSDGKFLAWQLWAAEEEIRAWAQYSRIRIINNETLRSFPIHLPPKGTQVTAAKHLDHFLDGVVRARNLLTQFSATMKQKRQALIAAAVTGQIGMLKSDD
ncbi:restriction endonuclease subunit S [Micromonospora sp. NBRC 101691]|uniref:restriction endonuclease subunit S n=1 Tax=Micromonospora sp. NBRC 101691 TaxID=3032198 RepID=UPI00255324C2|nr:restriction endonuclease subunit S [Micromonospora sp. NBRC 101691]